MHYTNQLVIDGNIQLADNKYIYVGEKLTSGSWRIGKNLNNLAIDKLKSGVWINEASIAEGD